MWACAFCGEVNHSGDRWVDKGGVMYPLCRGCDGMAEPKDVIRFPCGCIFLERLGAVYGACDEHRIRFFNPSVYHLKTSDAFEAIENEGRFFVGDHYVFLGYGWGEYILKSLIVEFKGKSAVTVEEAFPLSTWLSEEGER